MQSRVSSRLCNKYAYWQDETLFKGQLYDLSKAPADVSHSRTSVSL
jgi:hypothetical protein